MWTLILKGIVCVRKDQIDQIDHLQVQLNIPEG
jgi:hypothetical protein